MAHQTDGDTPFSESTHSTDQNLLRHRALPDITTFAALSYHSASDGNAPYPQKRPVSFDGGPQGSSVSQPTVLESGNGGLKQVQDPLKTGPKINNNGEIFKRGRGRPRKNDQELPKVQAARQLERLRISPQTKKQQQHKRPQEQRSGQQGSAHATTGRSSHDVSFPLSLFASQESDHDKLDKKERLRSRNRLAAEKCRIRKQRSIERLQDNAAAIETIHRKLTNEAASLREEVLMLKSMLLVHSHCGEPLISYYLEQAASDIARENQQFVSVSTSCNDPDLEIPASLLRVLETEPAGATTNLENASMAGQKDVDALDREATGPDSLETQWYSQYQDHPFMFAHSSPLEQGAPM